MSHAERMAWAAGQEPPDLSRWVNYTDALEATVRDLLDVGETLAGLYEAQVTSGLALAPSSAQAVRDSLGQQMAALRGRLAWGELLLSGEQQPKG